MSAPSSRNPIQIPGFGRVEPGSADDARLGALLGLAVGDALGTTHEFERLEQAPYPSLATRPATEVVGGGPFDLAPGQITDDTQMAICIARSLLASAAPPASATHHASSWFARLDAGDLAACYVAWSEHAFDIGNQTASALGRIAGGEPVLEAARAHWHATGRRAAGNGSLMRTAPLGVALAACPLEQIVEAALTDSLLTHADPRCLLAVAAFDVAIARAIASSTRHKVGSDARDPREPIAARSAEAIAARSDEPTARSGEPIAARTGEPIAARTEAMLAAAREGLALAAARMRELWRDDADDLAALASAEADLTRDLDAATAAEPGVYRVELDVHKTAGFVRVAFRLAFWHLAHTPWREAVVDVASRGGDADTNAAIVGALVGARDGVTAIPPAWVERVLAATQPGPAEWADAHHPHHLVALAAALR